VLLPCTVVCLPQSLDVLLEVVFVLFECLLKLSLCPSQGQQIDPCAKFLNKHVEI